MKIGFEVFLEVVREMSITKAANQLHITQQCASDHIKRLEKEYGVALFERRPKFHLTLAGEIMLQNLLNIQLMEANMSRNLSGIAAGSMGNFTVGISTSRAPVILPRILPFYYRKYPRVNISFTEEDTQILEERLLNGQVDLFIGVNTSLHPDYRIETLTTDEIILVVSSKLLKKEFSEQEIIEMENGIDLRIFSDIPFTQSFKTGKVNHVIQEYLDYYNVKLNVIYNISDSETQIKLCISGICVALCPRMLLGTAYLHNMTCTPEDRLYMFPVCELRQKLKIELVRHRNAVHPKYIEDFVQILKDKLPQIENLTGPHR